MLEFSVWVSCLCVWKYIVCCVRQTHLIAKGWLFCLSSLFTPHNYEAHIPGWFCPHWSSPWPRAPQTWPTWSCSGSRICPAPPSRPCTPSGLLAAQNPPPASVSAKSATGEPGGRRSTSGGELMRCFETLIHCVKAKRDTICSFLLQASAFLEMSSRQIKTLLDI